MNSDITDPDCTVCRRAGVSPPPGTVLVLHSLPVEFPLALALAEQLLSLTGRDGGRGGEEDLDAVPSSVLLQVVELMGENTDTRTADRQTGG